jgi:hypothetical protein
LGAQVLESIGAPTALARTTTKSRSRGRGPPEGRRFHGKIAFRVRGIGALLTEDGAPRCQPYPSLPLRQVPGSQPAPCPAQGPEPGHVGSPPSAALDFAAYRRVLQQPSSSLNGPGARTVERSRHPFCALPRHASSRQLRGMRFGYLKTWQTGGQPERMGATAYHSHSAVRGTA